MKTKLIDLRPLKIKALEWPEPARSLILSEADKLPLSDFLVKVGVWEKTINIQVVK